MLRMKFEYIGDGRSEAQLGLENTTRKSRHVNITATSDNSNLAEVAVMHFNNFLPDGLELWGCPWGLEISGGAFEYGDGISVPSPYHRDLVKDAYSNYKKQLKQIEKNELIRQAIETFAIDHLCLGGDGFMIYTNGMRYRYYSVEEDYENPKNTTFMLEIRPVLASKDLEYCNDKTVTLSFDGGAFYSMMNGEYGWSTHDKFDELVDSFGYHAEMGHSWNLALFD